MGIDAAPILRKAAREMDEAGKLNARIKEVEGKAEPSLVVQDVYYLERQKSDGSWEAESIADIEGQGRLMVRRTLRENLEPAMRMQMIAFLVRGAVFNEWEPAHRYVMDQCRFRLAGRLDA